MHEGRLAFAGPAVSSLVDDGQPGRSQTTQSPLSKPRPPKSGLSGSMKAASLGAGSSYRGLSDSHGGDGLRGEHPSVGSTIEVHTAFEEQPEGDTGLRGLR